MCKCYSNAVCCRITYQFTDLCCSSILLALNSLMMCTYYSQNFKSKLFVLHLFSNFVFLFPPILFPFLGQEAFLRSPLTRVAARIENLENLAGCAGKWKGFVGTYQIGFICFPTQLLCATFSSQYIAYNQNHCQQQHPPQFELIFVKCEIDGFWNSCGRRRNCVSLCKINDRTQIMGSRWSRDLERGFRAGPKVWEGTSHSLKKQL